MSATSVRRGAILWTLTKERQAWCNLKVKLCDPCLSALRLCIVYMAFFLSFPFLYVLLEEHAWAERLSILLCAVDVLVSVAYPQGGRVPPDFRPRGTVMQKPPSTFLTHSDAIAGFTSQSLGLLAYACKTDSSTAIKLVLRMHQNLSFWAQKSKKFMGRRHSHLLIPLPGGEGDT